MKQIFHGIDIFYGFNTLKSKNISALKNLLENA